MYKNKRVLGLITARGGSKGLPGKNIMPLAGKPVIAWTIEAALKSKYLDDLVLSTDDKRIAVAGRKYGAEVPFLRPKYLATDRSTSMEVVLHALSWLQQNGREYDYLVLLEPTSPLRESGDIDKAISILAENKVGAVSIVGVSRVEAAHPVFDVKLNKKGLLVPYVGSFKAAGRRQDITELYFFEGTVYVSEVEALKKRKSFYHEKTLPYIVPRWKSIEIDNIGDLICAEAMLKNIKVLKGCQNE